MADVAPDDLTDVGRSSIARETDRVTVLTYPVLARRLEDLPRGCAMPHHLRTIDRLVLPSLEVETAVRERDLDVEIVQVAPGDRWELAR